MDQRLKAAVKVASQREDGTLGHGGKQLLGIALGGLMIFLLMEAAANIDIINRLWASSIEGTVALELKPFDYSLLRSWDWSAGIKAADTTVIVTAAIVFVATFNVAAIASALERSVELPVTLTKFRWREGAAYSARFAVGIAFAVSLTRFPVDPGLGVGLMFLCLLGARGSQLVAGENVIAADRLVRMAYLHGLREQSNRALENALWGNAPTTFRFRVLTTEPVTALPWMVMLSALPVFVLTTAEAALQTLWSMSVMARPEFQGHVIDMAAVYSLWVNVDSAFTLLPGLVLVGVMILGLIGQARGTRAAGFLVIAAGVFICSLLVLLDHLYSGEVHDVLMLSVPWPFVLLVSLSLSAAFTGKGIGAPVPLTAMMFLKVRQRANEARLAKAEEDYLRWQESRT